MPRSESDPGQRPTARVRTPLSQRIADLRGGPLTAAAFLLAAFALWWLVLGQPQQRAFVALVRADEVILSGPADEVVAEVLVELFATVERGQVLCTFAGLRLEGELAVARAEALALEAEVAAESARLAGERRRIEFEARTEAERAAREHAAERRRLELDRETWRLEALRHDVELAAIDVDRRRYGVRLEVLAELIEPGLAPRAEAAELAERLAALEDEAARRASLRAAALAAAEDAAARLAAHDAAAPAALEPGGTDPEPVLAALRRRIEVQVARVAQLELLSDELVLRAPVGGRVERLVAHPGRRAVRGEELVALCADGPPRADLFVPEDAGERFTTGERLVLVAADPALAGVELEGEVLAEAPRLVELPPRLWRDPRRPEHGLAYLVALPEGPRPVPGTRLVARRLP